MRKKGIILTFEGFPKTVIESQVITHALDMRSKGLDLELWTFDVFSSTISSSREKSVEMQEKYGVTVRVFRGVRPAVPFSEFINAIIFFLKLKQFGSNVELVRCRGEYGTFVAGIVKPVRNLFLIWDCRGDTYWETRHRIYRGGFITRKVASIYCAFVRVREVLASRLCDRAIFVSESLQRLKVGVMDVGHTKVIPCSAPEYMFFFDPDIRSSTRTKLGYSPTDTVIVYSGSINNYQCFDESVGLVQKYMEMDCRIQFLVLTPNLELALPSIKQLPDDRVKLVSAKFEEVNAYLNAGDIALFLRRSTPLNTVASPVKFAEYSLTGLSVIMSNAVEQCVAHAKKLSNFIEYDWDNLPDIPKTSKSQRKVIAVRAAEILGRKSQREIFREIYELR